MPAPNAPPELSLESLVKSFQLIKAQEEHYRSLRVEIELAISALIPGELEGTESREVDGLKIKVVRKLTRTLDEKLYFKNMYLIPKSIDPVIYKPSLDLKKLRAIETANPEVFAVCQKFISVKPAKDSVKVEEVE